MGQTILLENKDFLFSKNEIKEIIELHNSGLHYQTIATQIKRDPIEIILCLLDIAEKGKQELRPLFTVVKPKTQKLDGAIGTELIVTAKITKTKKKKPTVINIDGEQYVLEHKNNF